MSEQLQAKLVEILTSIQATTKAAGDFAMEQLPDIAQSYVVYGRVYNTVAFVVFVAMTLAGLSLILKAVSNAKKRNEAGLRSYEDKPGLPSEGSQFAFLMAGIFTTVLGLVFTCINASGMFLVWFAPKVWLLKELAALIK